MPEYRITCIATVDIEVSGKDIDEAEKRAFNMMEYLNQVNLPAHVDVCLSEIFGYERLDDA